ncbi:hypothetical protein R3P38DRAFT_2935081 [Favolaschia claudopus]|uniref:Uncharacterized protein n=1 Tax=Favolaschia claudopus TaxID=2862362 RepID=A0AAW0BPP7_9AGAR
MPFPPDEAKLVSIFIQTLLYGAYVVVFGLTIWILVTRRAQNESANNMLGISVTMFVLATMHIGVNYTRIINAFVIFKDEPGGPAAYFNQLSNFTQIFGSTIYVAQTLVGDAVVLYRCYIVYGRSFPVIAFPSLLLLGSTAAGIGILYSFAKVVPQAEIFVVELQHWILSFFSLTLATNLICTILVASRIFYVNQLSKSFNVMSTSLRPVALLVIESGMVYSGTLMALLILYRAESWFQYVLLDAISPIVGLVFSMIIVRIGLGITTASGQTRHVSSSTIRFGSTNEANNKPIRLGLRGRRDNLSTGSTGMGSSGLPSGGDDSVKADEEV